MVSKDFHIEKSFNIHDKLLPRSAQVYWEKTAINTKQHLAKSRRSLIEIHDSFFYLGFLAIHVSRIPTILF